MRPRRIVLLGLLLCAVATASDASVGPLSKIPLVQLELRSLSGGPSAPLRELTLIADRPSNIEFRVSFGTGSARVRLSGRSEPVGGAHARKVLLQAETTLPDGRQIQSSRTVTVRDRTTILFELYREEDRPLTLAIVAELSETWEVIRAPSIGREVGLDVEVQRIELGKTTFRIEKNRLNTFEGLTVQYEFRNGQEPEDEGVMLSLTPVRLIEDLVEIEIRVVGRLSDGDGITLVARNETLVANRGASVAVNVVLGDPGTGYRFLVTPRF